MAQFGHDGNASRWEIMEIGTVLMKNLALFFVANALGVVIK